MLSSEMESLRKELTDIKTEYDNLSKQSEIIASQKEEKAFLIEDAIKDLPKNIASSKNSTTGSNSPECFEIIDRNSVGVKKRDSVITLEDNISNNSFNTNEWTSISVNTHHDNFDKASSEVSPKDTSPVLPNTQEFTE